MKRVTTHMFLDLERMKEVTGLEYTIVPLHTSFEVTSGGKSAFLVQNAKGLSSVADAVVNVAHQQAGYVPYLDWLKRECLPSHTENYTVWNRMMRLITPPRPPSPCPFLNYDKGAVVPYKIWVEGDAP